MEIHVYAGKSEVYVFVRTPQGGTMLYKHPKDENELASIYEAIAKALSKQLHNVGSVMVVFSDDELLNKFIRRQAQGERQTTALGKIFKYLQGRNWGAKKVSLGRNLAWHAAKEGR